MFTLMRHSEGVLCACALGCLFAAACDSKQRAEKQVRPSSQLREAPPKAKDGAESCLKLTTDLRMIEGCVCLEITLRDDGPRPVLLPVWELPWWNRKTQRVSLCRDLRPVDFSLGWTPGRPQREPLIVSVGDSVSGVLTLADWTDALHVPRLSSGHYDVIGVLSCAAASDPGELAEDRTYPQHTVWEKVSFPLRLMSFQVVDGVSVTVIELGEEETLRREREIVARLEPSVSLAFLLALEAKEAALIFSGLEVPVARQIMRVAGSSDQKEGLAGILDAMPHEARARLDSAPESPPAARGHETS